MAERRMFAKTIVLSDEFLDMPTSTRCLYFTLGMFADDEGFVNNPKSIIRQIGASVDDMNILIGKKFVIAFEDGVIVIKHWRIHNYIQNDRKKDTKYLTDKETLFLDENKAYTQNYEHAKYLLDGTQINGYKMDTKCIQNVYIGKDSIGKIKENKNSKEKSVEKKADDTTTQLDAFCKKFNIAIDNYSGRITELDYDKLTNAFNESKWLQTNITSLSKICREYERIIGGYYKDYKPIKKVNSSIHFANERKYTKEDYEKLYTDVDDLDI